MQLKVPNFDYVEHPVRIPPLQAGYEQTPARVLIAGGGPVGLAMALALAKQGIRSVVITGWDDVALERGFAIALILCALGIFGASRALRTRLVRT